ncbi:hypothetical protein H8E07_01865 [bacterium]|nr:hypothetical protein [bacterium]
MNLNTHVRELVTAGKLDELDILLPLEPRAIRHLVSLTYQPDDAIRANACRGVAMAARYHPELVEQVVKRLVWAMNDESGTNALTAPEVILAVAAERPQVLLPVVSDLTRLSRDKGLKEGLTEALRMVIEAYPGSVGRGIQKTLNKQFEGKNKYKKRGQDYGGCGCGKK